MENPCYTAVSLGKMMEKVIDGAASKMLATITGRTKKKPETLL